MTEASAIVKHELAPMLMRHGQEASLMFVGIEKGGFALVDIARHIGSQTEKPECVASEEDRDRLFEEFQPLIRRLIRQYGQTADARQDLAGEIFYRFHSLLESFDPSRGIPVRPYLVRQLCASVYTYARQGWRRKRREISLDMSAGFRDAAHQADPSIEWDRKMDLEHVLQGLPQAISMLSKRQRQVVIWRYYEQKSFEEIALILSIQVSTARSLLRHGLNNLRRRIAGGETNEE